MSNRHTSSNEKLIQAALNQRVKDLEAEVAELKTKLDQLRKAKSTTIVKRKREVIYVGSEVKQRANEATKISTDPAHCKKTFFIWTFFVSIFFFFVLLILFQCKKNVERNVIFML